MDTQTIDQAYAQLQTEFQDVAKTVQALAEKMQAAQKAGDANAQEWLLDLRQIAMDVNDEQTQANLLLQAIHQYVSEAVQQAAAPLAAAPAGYQQQPMAAPAGGMLGGAGGPFAGFLGGGFGRAMELGAGVGLGSSLISSIFN